MKIKSYVWVYDGSAPWHFVSIKKEDAKVIISGYHHPRRGFGAIPVNVLTGKTKWKTSIFPDRDGSYLLPIKKEIRKIEEIKAGDTISIFIELMV